MKPWKIVLASDHAGLALKEHLEAFLRQAGCQVVDVGTHTTDSCDYPDFAAEAGRRLAAGEFERGIFVCGTGLGIALAANKIPGVRAVPCPSEYTVELTRRHNDANVLCLGGWTIGTRLAEVLVNRFLETPFEGGRHARRVDKIKRLEAAASSHEPEGP